MLSLTCQTGIKAVIYLASRFEDGHKYSIKEIAEFIDASQHTLGKILQSLVKENIINSVKGPNGGFYITARQKKIPLLQIVVAIDGRDVFTQCGLGFKKCSSTHPCPIHGNYKCVRDLFEKMCMEKKMADLCDPVNSMEAYLVG